VITVVVVVVVVMIATLVVDVELLVGSTILVGGSQIHGWCFGGCSFWIGNFIQVELIHVQ